ncbi:hypothetical protein M433DRAFT_510571 [Acidomyces richmondensis BFW]|nr:hypothetical protein M433DRAFT_510571 [Acidomyces richmondensis BFW]
MRFLTRAKTKVCCQLWTTEVAERQSFRGGDEGGSGHWIYRGGQRGRPRMQCAVLEEVGATAGVVLFRVDGEVGECGDVEGRDGWSWMGREESGCSGTLTFAALVYIRLDVDDWGECCDGIRSISSRDVDDREEVHAERLKNRVTLPRRR